MGLLQWLFWLLLALGFLLLSLGDMRAAHWVFASAVVEWFIYGIVGAMIVTYRFARDAVSRSAIKREKERATNVSKT